MVIMGRLKLSYSDLFFYSIGDLTMLVKGHEIDLRDSWEKERVSTFIALSPYLEKGSNVTPQNVWPLPWDQVRSLINADYSTDESKIEFREKVAKFKERIEQHKQKVAKRKNGKS